MKPSDEAYADAIIKAAHVLISAVRETECDDGEPATGAELTLQVDGAEGEIQTWTILIDRHELTS